MPGPLVSYDSSSSDSEEHPTDQVGEKRTKSPASPTTIPPPPFKRKRGLPKLPSTFDNSMSLPPALRRAIEGITSLARELCPDYTIHSLVSTAATAPSQAAAVEPSSGDTSSTTSPKLDLPLHISLTHPLPLRHSQLITFRDEVRAALRKKSGDTASHDSAGPLRLSLAGDVVAFVNGRRSGGEGQGGRAFLALRVSAGSGEVERIVTQAIHPVLAKLHLPLYHTNPQFHTSFAWTLSGRQSANDPGSSDLDDASNEPPASARDDTPFTPDVLVAISERFGKALLAAQPKGGWEVQQLELKIGKDTHVLPIG